MKALNLATAQLMHVGDQGQIQKAIETLASARRSLYRILAEDDDS